MRRVCHFLGALFSLLLFAGAAERSAAAAETAKALGKHSVRSLAILAGLKNAAFNFRPAPASMSANRGEGSGVTLAFGLPGAHAGAAVELSFPGEDEQETIGFHAAALTTHFPVVSGVVEPLDRALTGAPAVLLIVPRA